MAVGAKEGTPVGGAVGGAVGTVGAAKKTSSHFRLFFVITQPNIKTCIFMVLFQASRTKEKNILSPFNLLLEPMSAWLSLAR